MNNERRKSLKAEIGQLEYAAQMMETIEISRLKDALEGIKSNVSSVCDDEEYAFDNMPEGLQCSMRGMTSEECIDYMNEALDLFDEIIDAEEENREEFKDTIESIIELLEDTINA